MGKFTAAAAWLLGDVVSDGGKDAFVQSVKITNAAGTAISSDSATSTQSNVSAAAADTSVLAANANRRPGSTVANDSTSVMYVLLGSGVASATNFTAAIDGKTTVPGVLTLPDGYKGAVRAFWTTATGSARVTELSA